MFTDDKLEEIYLKRESNWEYQCMKALIDTLTDPAKGGDLVADLKKANNMWKLFCSRHLELDSLAFKNYVIRLLPERKEFLNSIL